jgi:hypothetical protein
MNSLDRWLDIDGKAMQAGNTATLIFEPPGFLQRPISSYHATK